MPVAKKPASRDKRLNCPVAFVGANHVVDLDDTQGMNGGHAKLERRKCSQQCCPKSTPTDVMAAGRIDRMLRHRLDLVREVAASSPAS